LESKEFRQFSRGGLIKRVSQNRDNQIIFWLSSLQSSIDVYPEGANGKQPAAGLGRHTKGFYT
jgi:hypothetical protein